MLIDVLRTQLKPSGNYFKNAVKKIHLYKQETTWVFDDEYLGLKAEPFVCGASESIETIVQALNLNDKVNPVMFFGEKLPEYDCELELVEDTGESGWYDCKFKNNIMRLWLCSCLTMFFDHVPQTIYVKFKN